MSNSSRGPAVRASASRAVGSSAGSSDTLSRSPGEEDEDGCGLLMMMSSEQGFQESREWADEIWGFKTQTCHIGLFSSVQVCSCSNPKKAKNYKKKMIFECTWNNCKDKYILFWAQRACWPVVFIIIIHFCFDFNQMNTMFSNQYDLIFFCKTEQEMLETDSLWLLKISL